ncbi:hypothetical protein AJ80_08890 [Polytolypa hystricis UAMH7299]|uniref:ABM domain-containing protein n=1 Tax=Polytolypa hystricis (strain UAMH7299) TaxID=1447883 RepID=A0A2B7WZZ4_POLH7|nr:hypothetical protein AJ80_08890 [Polytolypa hystricis UAMH7299]
MAESMLVVAQMTTVGGSVRDEMIQKLQNLSEIALKSEPGILKYAVLVPREDDGKTVYAVEEYVDKAALDEHMATEAVKQLTQWLTENSVVEAAAIHNLEYFPGFRFSRESVLEHPDPYCMFAELDYVPGGVDTSIPYWRAVVETGRDNEPGTMVYGILKDTEKANRLCSIEAYESAEYLKDVHVPSKAIQESIANTKHLRTGLKHHFMKKRGGFLYRTHVGKNRL